MLLFFLCLLPAIKSSAAANSCLSVSDQQTRNKIAKSIIDDLSKEDYDGVMNYYDVGLKQNLPREKLQEVWLNIINTYGKFQQISSSNNIVREGYNQVISRVKFEKGSLTLELTFNQDDQVVGLFFKI